MGRRFAQPPRLPADAEIDRLAGEAKDGDRESAARLCTVLAPALRRYLGRVLASEDEAEDATQHVLVKMLGALPAYRERGIPFRAFVFRLAHNHALDRIHASERQRATDPQTVALLQEARQQDTASEGPLDARDSIASLLAPLPPSQQHVLLLIHVHDLSPAQVGSILGRSAGDVRQLHKRGRDTLREIVMMQSG